MHVPSASSMLAGALRPLEACLFDNLSLVRWPWRSRHVTMSDVQCPRDDIRNPRDDVLCRRADIQCHVPISNVDVPISNVDVTICNVRVPMS